ncbi:nitrogen fixation NifU-like protein [Roseivirga ehrenbergii]|uniref:NIF system FeS cluster assembly NifU N-terminal domain-containing protein n=1 Tax=Roseivirga ehrenbergii (strain DSM 102268 / JCM 13514 / KCTC 12282 / NCIMB 14502 / KMM 6017) TaxID=279360 RepID=A0A150X6X9_ROSEK|nr:SUF system NifU family Fe-S cluster assembly protein [Roseivirga ehrenbergii]KYG74446.1 hypothetical protein MB14_04330 [Roseivirga ehrenbergii]TCL14250.1 nitrogen fixation NifU-like protein [Roseivirga ehrenbergii]
MNDRLKALYKTQILVHAKSHFNEGVLEDYTHKLQAYNPVCGDQFDLYLKFEDNIIQNTSFKGYGCAISKASTSVLTKHLLGKTRSEAKALIELFLKVIDPESSESPESLTSDEELLAFASAREFPERLTCANLAWKKLKEVL